MKRHAAQSTNKSLKTFFFYAGIVLFVILISLALKAYHIVTQSVFDGDNQFVIALAKGSEVKEVLSLDPQGTVSLLRITGKPLPVSSLGNTLGVATNTLVQTSDDAEFTKNPTALLTDMLVQPQRFSMSLTVYDNLRLLLLAQKEVHETVLQLPGKQEAIDSMIQKLFSDNTISDEDMTIQIINASGKPGLAGRLERVLTNKGANVISLKTSYSNIKESTISFYGDMSMTVDILQDLLHFSTSQMNREGVANIIITIGEDANNSISF